MEVTLTLTMVFRAPAENATAFIEGIADAINTTVKEHGVETRGGEMRSKPCWPGED